MSEFSEHFSSSRIVSHSRLFWGIETSKGDSLVSNLDPSYPSPFVAVYAFITACTVRESSAMNGVLGVRALTQILSAIIESVVVSVVNLFGSFATHNLSMHNFSAPDRREALREGVPMRKPIPPREPFKIRRIYDGILSLRKWNQAVGCIKRLNNFVSVDATFHKLTSHGLVTAAILT